MVSAIFPSQNYREIQAIRLKKNALSLLQVRDLHPAVEAMDLLSLIVFDPRNLRFP
jgi:hypothetical protein